MQSERTSRNSNPRSSAHPAGQRQRLVLLSAAVVTCGEGGGRALGVHREASER